MENLNKEQEELLLEQGREKDYEEMEAKADFFSFCCDRGLIMKTINITLTDEEFKKMQKAKKKLNELNNTSYSWERFILRTCTKGISIKKELKRKFSYFDKNGNMKIKKWKLN